MKKRSGSMPAGIRRILLAAAIGVAAVLMAVHFAPVAVLREGNEIQMETGQTMSLHLKNAGPFTRIAAVRDDRPSVARVGNNLTLHAENPGECTIQLISIFGKKISCRVSVSCREGLLKDDTLKKYDADSCRNLMIVAHPDDETLWGGAHLKDGNYFIVCLTNGNNRIRAREYRKILKASGSKGIILNYPDIYHHVKNDWSLVREGISNDLNKILNYKDWDKIVTYNPDGVTGHIHHRMTYEETIALCKKDGLTDHVYYFGKYYKKGTIPAGLKGLDRRSLDFKESLVNIYQHEMRSINHYWRQMIPYENWVRYRDWK